FAALVSLLAGTHPVPIWPDNLPAHWTPPPDADVSRVWALSQIASGLTQRVPVWNLLRILSLISTALLGFALYRVAAQPERSDVDVHEVVERRLPVGMEAG
ncbi:MAG: hypothetical protein JO101_12970, partial [Candidatus Eremiobacteraeota bacterium]|nr:hypothetical protein [Candidatus Eremiobacteraeota bacterium]